MKQISSETELIRVFTGLLHKDGTYKLVFQGQRLTKEICIFNSNILYATSDRLQDKLSEILFKAGKLTQDQYLLAAELSIVTKKKIGDILIREGFLARDDIVQGLAMQARKIICSLFEYPEWYMSVLERGPHDDVAITPQLPIIDGLLAGIRSVDNFSALHDALPAKDEILEICPDREAFVQQVEFTADEGLILTLIDGCRTLQEILDASKMFEYHFYKTLYPLLALNVAAPVGSAREADQLNVGVLGAAGTGEDDAVDDIDVALPVDGETRVDEETLFEEAKLMMSSDQYSAAANKLKALIARNSKKSIYYYYLGLALDHVPGQNKEAEKVFKIAIRLQHYNPRYYLALGHLYLRRNMKQQAEKQFLTALKWDPNDRYVKEALEYLKKSEKKKFGFLTTKLF
jgi:tetratricopeptide (TPR) repeat protein